MPPIQRLLIANRGEIARRILRTCRDRGVVGIAVYSDADADAPFVREADIAVRLGPAAPSESYLSAERLIAAARRVGADAIHPGYGFLSEDARLAEAVLAAGLIWVGPSAAAMAAVGDKAAARALAEQVGVPINRGYSGEDQSSATFTAEAARIGFPLLVKAAAGGGGRGMRRVDAPDALVDALKDAATEAERSFGSGKLLLERLVVGARHVEVQLLADSHGNIVHLGERECSVQRRNQKVLEEAPCPAVDADLRAKLGGAAIAIAKAAGYVGAGTAEFLLAPDGSFTFLEVNARLQVEHPVTELVTGLDLVAMQLLVAEGAPLPFTQHDVQLRGHAIEARLIAEDPSRDYAPGVGQLHRVDIPTGEGVRLDLGVVSGDTITPHYDAMIGKLIAWGPDRATAGQRLARVVRGAWVPGVATNLPLLRDVLAHPLWLNGQLDTAFLARAGLPGPLPTHSRLGAVIATAYLAARLPVTWPSAAPLGFTLGEPDWQRERWTVGGETVEVGWRRADDALAVQVTESGISSEHLARVVGHEGDRLDVIVDQVRYAARAMAAPERFGGLDDGDTVYLHFGDGEAMLTLTPRLPAPAGVESVPGTLLAPTPGTVTAVLVAIGDAVRAGQPLVTLEAMKMAHTVSAPDDGVVSELRVVVGDAVEAGALLARVTTDGAR